MFRQKTAGSESKPRDEKGRPSKRGGLYIVSEYFELLSAEAALLAFAVRVAGTGIESSIRPLTLNLPLRAVAESDRRSAKSPCAFVAILLALGVIPTAIAWISHRFREFMPAHVGDGCKALRF